MKRFLSGIFILMSTYFSMGLNAQTLEEAIVMTEKDLFEDAEKSLRTLISQNPADAKLYFYLGDIFFKNEEIDSAATYYSKGISVDANSALNLVGQGKIKLSEKKYDEAKVLFEKAVTIAGDKDAYIREKVAEAYVNSGYDKLEYALALLDQAIKLDPKKPSLYLLLGEANLNAFNDGSTAITNYEKAFGLNPQSSLAKLKIGELYIRSRSYEEALKNYEEAIAIAADFAPAYRAMGDLFYLFNRYDDAKKNYAKYLELVKNSRSAKIRYAKFLFLAKDYENTIIVINEIISESAASGKEVPTVMYRLLGYSYFEQGQFAEGLEVLKKFYAVENPARLIPSDYAYLARLYSKTKQDSLAIIEFQKAIELDTTKFDLYNELGTSYMKTKQYKNAIDIFNQKIQKTGKGSTTDYYLLGQAYERDSQFVKADSSYIIVVQKSPDKINGYLGRARANYKMDSDGKLGLADSHYVKVIEIASLEPDKYKKELIEGMYYFVFKHYMNREKAKAKEMNDKILAIDAADKRSLDMQKLIEKLADQ